MGTRNGGAALAVTFVTCLFFFACAFGPRVEKNKQYVASLRSETPITVPRLGVRPRSYESHYNKALSLLYKKHRTDFDLQLARAGFETAARLSRDYWPAWFYVGLTDDLLGNHDPAVDALVKAATITDNAALWNAAALAALHGGYEQLARDLHRRAEKARVASDDRISRYLTVAYAADADADPSLPRTPVAPLPDAADGGPKVVCIAKEKDDDDDDKDKSDSGYDLNGLNLDFSFADDKDSGQREKGKQADPPSQDCAMRNVVVDAYIVRRTGQSTSTSGINLLSSLELQFGGQLLDYTHQKTSGSAAVTSRGRSFTIGIPDVTYALGVATDQDSFVTIDASPSIVARLGQTSKIFDGTEVYIVSSGDYGSGEFEKEIGVTMSIQPHILTDTAVTMSADLEFSNLYTSATPSDRFQMLNTDKLTFTIDGTFPYGTAAVIGKLASSIVKGSGAGQPGLRSVPGLNALFGENNSSALSRDVLVLLSVHRPNASMATLENALLTDYRRFGVVAANTAFVRHGYIHQAPALSELVAALKLDTPGSVSRFRQVQGEDQR